MNKFILLIATFFSVFLFCQKSDEDFFNKGVTEMQRENYQTALSIYNKVITKNPNNTEALEYRAFTKLKIKKYSDALLDINKAIKINESCSGCFETRAEIKYRLNDLSGSVKDYERAFQLEPILANSDNYYQVAKSKLSNKNKLITNQFIPNAELLEKIILGNANFTTFYNQYYDFIESFTDNNFLSYNEKTNEHDLPRYQADVYTKYKGAKIYFTLISRTENEPLYDVKIETSCVCEWFGNWKSISTLGFKEYKRFDSKGVLEIWGKKGNVEIKYSLNTNSQLKTIELWKSKQNIETL